MNKDGSMRLLALWDRFTPFERDILDANVDDYESVEDFPDEVRAYIETLEARA